MVYGEAVGSEDVRADDHLDVVAGERGAHDARTLLVPVSPEHQAEEVSRGETQSLLYTVATIKETVKEEKG